jgi:hypothetical protein
LKEINLKKEQEEMEKLKFVVDYQAWIRIKAKCWNRIRVETNMDPKNTGFIQLLESL